MVSQGAANPLFLASEQSITVGTGNVLAYMWAKMAKVSEEKGRNIL